jgi:LuxR family maltose regulon positive regulatory protein
MIGLGELAYRRDDIAEADRQLSAGIALAERGGVRDALTMGYTLLVLLRQAQGRPDAARAASEAFLRFAREEFSLPRTLSLARAVAARLALLHGDHAAAVVWAHSHQPPAGALFQSQTFEFSTYLSILIATERADLALLLIAGQQEYATAVGDIALELDLSVANALAHAALGQMAAAVVALDHALTLAAPIGAQRVFRDEGAPMVALLRHAQRRGRLHAYGERVLTAIGESELGLPKQQAIPRHRGGSTLAEPLTPREHEILRWIAEGRSNQEIANTLVVSVGTIKTHLHNLYGKLDARDRTQAIVRARAIGLLDEQP